MARRCWLRASQLLRVSVCGAGMGVWRVPELGSRDLTDHGGLLGGVLIRLICVQRLSKDCNVSSLTQIGGLLAKRTTR